MTPSSMETAVKPESSEQEAEQISIEAVSQRNPQNDFLVVALGASAGGLAAFEAFFSGMPVDKNPDMAFVLVQHLAPDHKSILTELIRRYTRMQVFEVQDGVVVQPNCVYIIPPNRDMAIINGALELLEPVSPRGQRLPIDFFFRSLAQDQYERAVCIVLSGTGSDGTLGLRAVKGEGGIVIAQNPESAEYDGMPRSAIETGLVDYVLSPADMAPHLMAYAAHVIGKNVHPMSPAFRMHDDDAFSKIFILLRAQTGHDFSQYKQNTIRRRVERRMAVQQVAELDEYIRFLQQTPVEVETLFCDLLINVTSFFRDPEAFATLETMVIPRILNDRADGSEIRVWICGCSTGEEAYSIAILLQEQVDKLQRNFQIQIFATDIDKRSINQARSGRYPASIAADVSPERLAHFFRPESDGRYFRIKKAIRDMLVFSEQDVVKDPPFSKLDLISCRNLLIYINSDLQKKLIPLFHYALNPGGYLFLGTSESIGNFDNLFSTLDRQAKLYQRKEDISIAQRLPLGRFVPPMFAGGKVQKRFVNTSNDSRISLRDRTERILLDQYTPASVLVSMKGEILYIHGKTGRFLQMASGEPGLNILKMAREGLKRELTSALHQAVKENKIIEHPRLHVKTNGDYCVVNLKVQPVEGFLDLPTKTTLYLVVFEELQIQEQLLPAMVCATPLLEEAIENISDTDALITALRQELRAKDEYLKSTSEELETSNEELKSSNEEMQSINEELQSTNEELETSKEELQSVNEELATVNNELQTKVMDLSRANNDMNNLLAGTGVGTIFVDFQLLIQRFTPSVTQVINLIRTDVGRPVGHIVSNLVDYGTLVEDIRSVLDTLVPKELEVQTIEGEWFLLRIRPYRTLDNVIEGAVITFFDISEIKRVREELIKANEKLSRFAVVLRDSNDSVLLHDMEGRILAWNPAAKRMYGWSESEALQMNIRELIPENQLENTLERIKQLSRNNILEPYRTQRLAKDGSLVDVWLTATALVNESGEVYAIATTERATEM